MIDGPDAEVVFALYYGVVVVDVRCIKGTDLLVTGLIRRGEGDADADGECGAQEDFGLVDDGEGLDGREVEEQ